MMDILEAISFFQLELMFSYPFIPASLGLVAWVFGTRFADKWFPEGNREPVTMLNHVYPFAVIVTLFLLASVVGIDHAVHRTVCCNYELFQKMASMFENVPAWRVLFTASAVLATYGLVLLSIGLIAVLVRRKWRNLLRDSLYGVMALVLLLLTWTAAMGHSEPNWERGYRWVWLWGVAVWVLVVVQREYFSHTLRNPVAVLNCVIGLLFSFVIPIVMVNLRPYVVYKGLIIHEDHAGSTRYIFAVILLSAFWILDLCLTSRRKAAGSAEALEGLTPIQNSDPTVA